MSPQKPRDRKHSITMIEIAQLAGVSQSTVSRVLSGSTNVVPEKKAAVLKVIEELNYRPNIAAQGLVSGRTLQIGVLTRHLGSPYFSEMLRGMAVGMEGTGYHPVIGLGNEVPREDRSALDLLLSRGVDGVIVQAPQYFQNSLQDYLCQVAEKTPLIIIGGRVPGLEKQCVTIKNYAGAYLATSHLIAKGHHLIAHVTGKMEVDDAIQRRDGYCQALLDHGIALNPDLIIEGDFSEVSGAHAAEMLLARHDKYPITAIFAANDQMAVGVRFALYYRGITVPDDISLIGFDDLPGTQYMIPPLTTIRQPVYYMGLIASQAMLALLDGDPINLPEIPLELVVRQSVAFRGSVTRMGSVEQG